MNDLAKLLAVSGKSVVPNFQRLPPPQTVSTVVGDHISRPLCSHRSPWKAQKSSAIGGPEGTHGAPHSPCLQA